MSDAVQPKRSKISQTDIPGVSLEQALRVATVIADQYGKASTRPFDVATALEMSPTSGNFRYLCGASIGYGITDGGPNAPLISLTELGRRIVAPLVDGDDLAAKRQAVLTPTVIRRFLERYDGSPLPAEKIAHNVLESLEVPTDRVKAVYDLVVQNAKSVGYLKQIKDKTYVDLGGQAPAPQAAGPSDPDELKTESEPEAAWDGQLDRDLEIEPPARERDVSNAIFLGHGSNRAPLEQLIKILNEYGIPHKEAIAEPNAGRPIPTKVADTMRSCGAAILIFTADTKLFDENGDEVWRPSENVSNELGAASVLYGNRIVIFKEKGVNLASNYSSIGYIEFEKDKLADKGIDLFRELVNFKIVSIKVG